MAAPSPPRVSLAHLPTPLEPLDRLTNAWGGPTIWVKRDDLTGFGLSGNKVRKLEYHFGAAAAKGATAVVTCGAVQSNHCRATAIAAARVGLDCTVVLRTNDANPPAGITGNHLLQRLAGAEVRCIGPEQFRFERDQIMQSIADDHGAMHVIPVGASDALGMRSFVDAATELADQWATSGRDDTPVIWHASSSGGTSAGLAVGVHRSNLQSTVIGTSVGESEAELWHAVHAIVDSDPMTTRSELARLELTDRHVGLGYGRTTDEELAIQVEASRLTGLIWDPTYTGKAVVGLKREIDAGRFTSDHSIILWHTGGGFAAFAHDFSRALG